MISAERLDQICRDAVSRCTDEVKDVSMPLMNEELDATYECFLLQYGQELAEGAFEKSEMYRAPLLWIERINQPLVTYEGARCDAWRDCPKMDADVPP
jgi:hypothetical protein